MSPNSLYHSDVSRAVSAGCLTEAQADELTGWVPPYSSQDASQLQEAGADEQFGLGQRWRELYPDLLAAPYSERHYKARLLMCALLQ